MAGNQQKFQTAMVHAERFTEDGKWIEAMKAYRYALAEFPNNSAAIIGFGKAGLAAGQTELAKRAFEQALKINPTNLDALNLTADLQERTGQFDAAAETYLRMGNVYASRNSLDQAIEFWLRATKLTSGHVDAHRKLAEALAQQGKERSAAREYLTLAAIFQRRQDQQRAREEINHAGALVPGDPGIEAALEALETGSPIQPHNIGEAPPVEDEPVLDFEGDFSDDDLFGFDELFASEASLADKPLAAGLLDAARQLAMEELANLIFEDSDNPNTMLIMQGLDLQSRDEVMEAISCYRQAIKAGASQASLHFNLGLLYRQQGQLNDAADMLKVSAQDQKYQVSSKFALGETYYSAHNPAEAMHYFLETLRVVDLQTVSGQRAYDLAQIYDKLDENFLPISDSVKISQFVTSMQNFFSSSDWERKVYEARQRMNSVAEDSNFMSLAEFLETPETEVIVTTLAITNEYVKSNLLMTASEECLHAIQKAPSFLPLHARLADILLRQDRTEEAITKYLYIARVYRMRNQPEQAVNIYNKVLRLAPMDVTVRSKLIDLYVAHDNLSSALEQYLHLADSYYQLAQVDRALDKYNEAVKLATRAEDGERWEVEALTRMADIYNQRFDWAGATAAYEKLMALNPDDQRITRQLVDLYYKQNKINEATTILDRLLHTYQRQNPAKALEFLKDLSANYPDNLLLRQRLAVAYVQNNMVREAIAEYDALGEMQLESGLRDQAVQTIQAIINLGPRDVEGYRRLLAQISGGAV